MGKLPSKVQHAPAATDHDPNGGGLLALAEQVFGDPQKSFRWLRSGKSPLAGRSPLQVVSTEAGARLVEEMLYQIDEGMPS